MILVDVILVCTDLAPIDLDLFSQSVDVVSEIVDGGLKGFKGNKNFSLDLDSLLVVILVPDLFTLIKLVNLLVKVSTRQLLTVLLGVIRLPVMLADVKARFSLMVVLIGLLGNHCVCLRSNCSC